MCNLSRLYTDVRAKYIEYTAGPSSGLAPRSQEHRDCGHISEPPADARQVSCGPTLRAGQTGMLINILRSCYFRRQKKYGKNTIP